MTEQEINDWLYRAARKRSRLGKSIHRMNTPANDSLMEGFQFAELDTYELSPAQ